MPNRYIREAYIGSESVNTLGWQAEVFWMRLVLTVDDWGRCEASPKLLRAKLFPLRLDSVREADVSRLIAECEKAGLVRLYSSDGKEYLQMFKWEIGRALESKHPAPPQPMLDACYLDSPTSVRKRKQMKTDAPDSDNDYDPVSAQARDKKRRWFPEGLNTPEFHDLWGEWEEHCLALRKPHSIASRKAQLVLCERAGLAAASMAIQRSIEGNCSWLLWDSKNGKAEAPQTHVPRYETPLQKRLREAGQ